MTEIGDLALDAARDGRAAHLALNIARSAADQKV
jgi:hypothetical protein